MRVRVLDDVGALEARQLDDLLDEPGQAVGLDADPLGEARDRLGVVVRVEHGLGEQRDAADRGLELVADVGEEVAPDLLDAGRLGAVLDEEQHVVGAEGRDAGGDDEAPVPEALLQGQLGLADDRRRGAPAGPGGAARGARAPGRAPAPARRRRVSC